MVICFQCSASTKFQLDAMVASGEYADYGDAISAAVHNQTVLGQRMTENGSFVMSAETTPGQRTASPDLVLIPKVKAYPSSGTHRDAKVWCTPPFLGFRG